MLKDTYLYAEASNVLSIEVVGHYCVHSQQNHFIEQNFSKARRDILFLRYIMTVFWLEMIIGERVSLLGFQNCDESIILNQVLFLMLLFNFSGMKVLKRFFSCTLLFFPFKGARKGFFLKCMMLGGKCNGSEEFMVKTVIILSYASPVPFLRELLQLFLSLILLVIIPHINVLLLPFLKKIN